ncbi:ABC transporter substrate-binding protein [Aureimonas sp. ME7]|uniref:ABC transporter substrate-binding protein n=1 Tax=Aureimonas sp. ME7 TaxID=2744252 RepID=UPI0015F56A6F|nr:ABC transporter substrate-binding protein [Aureimonas sp. ME7]
MKGLSLAFAALLATTAGAFAQGSTDITVVLDEELDLVEPCMATRSNIGRVILQNISETLTELDTKNGGAVAGRLAESWEDRGEGTWRFKLREGVKFSDGTAFDAADVKHSLERATSPKIACESSRYFGDTKLSATVVDPGTIDIKAEPPQPILPLLMSVLTIVPEETPVEFTRQPVGTGPYVLSQWNPGQNIVLTRRDDYWGEAPKVTKSTYVFRSDSAVRAAMVQAGEADLAPSISVLEATNPATDFSYPNSETMYLRIDTSIPPMNDKRVRQALNMAIDRTAFIGSLLPEGTEPAVAIVPPTTLGWNKDVHVPAYDVEGAKALLEAARADGVPVDTPIELIGRTNNYPNATEVNEAIQAMLQDAGFNVQLRMLEVAEQERLYSKPYQEGRGVQLLSVLHDNAKGDPVFSAFFKYHSDGRQSGISDPKTDDLITRASAATGEERAKLWSELFAHVHDDVVADVLLFHMVGFARVAERLDFRPSIATNSQLQLSEIGFKP